MNNEFKGEELQGFQSSVGPGDPSYYSSSQVDKDQFRRRKLILWRLDSMALYLTEVPILLRVHPQISSFPVSVRKPYPSQPLLVAKGNWQP